MWVGGSGKKEAGKRKGERTEGRKDGKKDRAKERQTNRTKQTDRERERHSKQKEPGHVAFMQMSTDLHLNVDEMCMMFC